MRGGRRRFAVEAKVFEIQVEEVGGKLKGCVWEKCKGFTSWVRFGDGSLRKLLDGVEAYCRNEEESCRQKRIWKEEGRNYTLERRENKAGGFLRCSVRDEEAKFYSIFVPEGKGVLGGWHVLAQTLRELGVSASSESSWVFPVEEGFLGKELQDKSFLQAAKTKPRSKGEPLVVEVEKRETQGRLEKLCRCLVGIWVDFDPSFDFEELKPLLADLWALKGKLEVFLMGRGLFLLEFELSGEAERVLNRGSRRLLKAVFQLERWGPEVGCFNENAKVKEAWVRVVGLPLHLWSRDILKKIGDGCEGFVAVDERTAFLSEFQWARVLVKFSSRDLPSSVTLFEGGLCFVVHLWWELPAWSEQRLLPEVKTRGFAMAEGDGGEGGRARTPTRVKGGCFGREGLSGEAAVSRPAGWQGDGTESSSSPRSRWGSDGTPRNGKPEGGTVLMEIGAWDDGVIGAVQRPFPLSCGSCGLGVERSFRPAKAWALDATEAKEGTELVSCKPGSVGPALSLAPSVGLAPCGPLGLGYPEVAAAGPSRGNGEDSVGSAGGRLGQRLLSGPERSGGPLLGSCSLAGAKGRKGAALASSTAFDIVDDACLREQSSGILQTTSASTLALLDEADRFDPFSGSLSGSFFDPSPYPSFSSPPFGRALTFGGSFGEGGMASCGGETLFPPQVRSPTDAFPGSSSSADRASVLELGTSAGSGLGEEGPWKEPDTASGGVGAWEDSCLRRFSLFLGFPTGGLKEKFLTCAQD